MSSLPYFISKKARMDLDEIWIYTFKKWSIAQADRYYSLIIEEIEHICKLPESGKPMDHIRKNYRASKVKSHLIFYKITGKAIEIIRILHERMDVDKRLAD